MDDRALRSAFGQRVELPARLAVVVQRRVEMAACALPDDARQQGLDRVLDVAEKAEVDRAAVAERLRSSVDLRNASALRVERPVGEVRSEQQQGIAVLH